MNMWMKCSRKNKNISKAQIAGFILAVSVLGACNTNELVETPIASVENTVVGYNYQSDWLNVKNAGLETSDAPNLILLPGLASSSQSWNAVIDMLGATHHLHIVDVSGFAGTSVGKAESRDVVDGIVQDLGAYITQNHLEHVTIMGHSLGGFSALKTAYAFGDKIDQIIIVDSLPFYASLFNPAATAEMMGPQADQIRAQTIGMEAEDFKTSQTQFVQRMSKNTQARTDILNWSVQSDRMVLANALHNLLTQDMRPKLEEISTPVHVVYAWDVMMGISAEQIDSTYKTQYAGLKNASFSRVDNSFHFIMHDQPEVFLATVQPILNTK